MTKYSTKKLTRLGLEWLRQKYPEAVIVPEFTAAAYGERKIDLVAVTALNGLVGIEIKGEKDSLKRMEIQGPAYSKVCTQMYLLPAPKFHDKANRLIWSHPGWGLLKIIDVAFVDEIIMHHHPSNPQNCPYRLCEILWKTEVVKLARLLDLPPKKAPSTCSKHELVNIIVESISLGNIRAAVNKIMRERDWERVTSLRKKNFVDYPKARAVYEDDPVALPTMVGETNF